MENTDCGAGVNGRLWHSALLVYLSQYVRLLSDVGRKGEGKKMDKKKTRKIKIEIETVGLLLIAAVAILGCWALPSLQY